MKRLKKMMALIIAVAMVLGMTSMAAFAADDPPVGNVSKDASVSVSGLQSGDSVKFVQVIKWVDGVGWRWADGMEDVTDPETGAVTQGAATKAGVTLPALTTITGVTTPSAVAGTISAEHAAIIAKAAAKLTTTVGSTVAAEADGSDYKATYSDAPAGLYYAQVIPGTADYLYNTIFVGADFKSDNNTNSINASTATVGNAQDTNAIAKREQVTLDKKSMPATADNAEKADDIKYDHNVGDVIDFEIESKVPAYAAGYINPHYILSDTLEDGLVLVKADKTELTNETIKANVTVTIENVTLADTDYTLVKDGNGFKLTLASTGLAKVAATGVAQKITVTYKAMIKSLDAGNVTVTEKTNTATVDFSNKPTDESSYSLLEDKTRHYTFSLDANLLGYQGESYETDELVKVGLDGDGNPVSEVQHYHSGTTWSDHSPLQGAKFALFKENPAAADYASETAALASTKLYTNPTFTGIVESDGNGRLNITGLDEGTYYLREISAPTGYIKDDRTFAITIAATYQTIDAGSYNKNVATQGEDPVYVKVNYNSYKVLDAYTVTVNDGTGNTVSTYDIVNKGDVQNYVVDKATYEEKTEGEITGDLAGDAITPISNTQGTALPSTGGIGTTIFYVVGAILVIGAGVILITRRRMDA